MAWGGPTCNGNHPDVFADVSKAVGFIDWATRCVEGQDVDHYKFGQRYIRWAKRQYCKRKDEIKIRKQKVNYVCLNVKFVNATISIKHRIYHI